MEHSEDIKEKINAGETASIENTHSSELSISLISEDGYRVSIALAPGQILEFTAGTTDAKIVLHDGDPAKLLIIKPELAS